MTDEELERTLAERDNDYWYEEEMTMRYEVYSDETGTGTGDFLGDAPTLEEARATGEAHWCPEEGYTIHAVESEYGSGPVVEHKPPTHPERQYVWNDDPYNETGRY